VLSYRASLTFVLSAVLAASPAFASRAHRAPTSGHAATAHHSHKGTSKGAAKGSTRASSKTTKVAAASHRLHGQQAIDPSRVTEIQQALIREHYLTDEANGRWDSTTEGAMQKFQADQGWQTRLMPDPRAIKKLGLGADYSGAINAKDANFGDPPPVSTIPSDQASGFAMGAGISR